MGSPAANGRVACTHAHRTAAAAERCGAVAANAQRREALARTELARCKREIAAIEGPRLLRLRVERDRWQRRVRYYDSKRRAVGE